MKLLNITTLILVIVGALNWGLVGALDFNLVSFLLGMGMLANTVYVLVGISAVYQAIVAFKKPAAPMM
ncbi:MAG: DUF378 domain-containing protein [Minisyncoccia bacterium]